MCKLTQILDYKIKNKKYRCIKYMSNSNVCSKILGNVIIDDSKHESNV